ILAFLHLRERPNASTMRMYFQIVAPENASTPNLSPDGRKLAFVVRDRLWVYSLETGEFRDLTVTTTGGKPFWSPASPFIAYPSDDRLKKIEATGGSPQTVANIPGNLWGCGAWSRRDGLIVFGDRRTGLYRVSSSGGVPVQITALDPTRHEFAHFCPSFLPD